MRISHRVRSALRHGLKGLLTAGLIVQLTLGATFQNTSSPQGTVDTDRGLHVASFDTLYGKVVVNLPDDMAAGDTISGTVEAQPAGKQADEVAKNQDELNGLVIEIAGTKLPSKDQTAKINVPEQAPEKIPVIVRDKTGKEVGRAEVPVKPRSAVLDCLKQQAKAAPNAASIKAGEQSQPQKNPSLGCPFELPAFGQPGRPLEIKGNFTGDAGQTGIKIGGKDARVLAESPRKVVTQVPSDVVGAS